MSGSYFKKPPRRVFRTVALTISFLALGGISIAQEAPSWVKPLPHGDITCISRSADGFEWNSKTESYRQVTFPARTFTIQKMDASDPKISGFNCDPKDRLKSHLSPEEYIVDACYRFDNATNMLGWIQGWCTEKYTKGKQPFVTCESPHLQPKLGFQPESYFYSYGRAFTTAPDQPSIRAGYTELGSCGFFKAGYGKKFKAGSQTAYYPE